MDRSKNELVNADQTDVKAVTIYTNVQKFGVRKI